MAVVEVVTVKDLVVGPSQKGGRPMLSVVLGEEKVGTRSLGMLGRVRVLEGWQLRRVCWPRLRMEGWVKGVVVIVYGEMEEMGLVQEEVRSVKRHLCLGGWMLMVGLEMEMEGQVRMVLVGEERALVG
jgi:hypothetical protein